jgi:hypothetical protein
MITKNIAIIFILIILIGVLIQLINNQITNINTLKRAIIKQDLNLENKFNDINKDYENIANKTNNIINRIENKDCIGDFGACYVDKDSGKCIRKYKIYKSKQEDGLDCKYDNNAIEYCSDGGDNCEPNKDCIGEWSECLNNKQKFIVSQKVSGNGKLCNNKNGDTQFC